MNVVAWPRVPAGCGTSTGPLKNGSFSNLTKGGKKKNVTPRPDPDSPGD